MPKVAFNTRIPDELRTRLDAERVCRGRMNLETAVEEALTEWIEKGSTGKVLPPSVGIVPDTPMVVSRMADEPGPDSTDRSDRALDAIEVKLDAIIARVDRIEAIIVKPASRRPKTARAKPHRNSA